MNSISVKIITKIHLFVLTIGFVIGFGFVPEVRQEFSNMMPKTETCPHSDPKPIPDETRYVPKQFAILPKTKIKTKNGRI